MLSHIQQCIYRICYKQRRQGGAHSSCQSWSRYGTNSNWIVCLLLHTKDGPNKLTNLLWGSSIRRAGQHMVYVIVAIIACRASQQPNVQALTTLVVGLNGQNNPLCWEYAGCGWLCIRCSSQQPAQYAQHFPAHDCATALSRLCFLLLLSLVGRSVMMRIVWPPPVGNCIAFCFRIFSTSCVRSHKIDWSQDSIAICHGWICMEPVFAYAFSFWTFGLGKIWISKRGSVLRIWMRIIVVQSQHKRHPLNTATYFDSELCCGVRAVRNTIHKCVYKNSRRVSLIKSCHTHTDTQQLLPHSFIGRTLASIGR